MARKASSTQTKVKTDTQEQAVSASALSESTSETVPSVGAATPTTPEVAKQAPAQVVVKTSSTSGASVQKATVPFKVKNH